MEKRMVLVVMIVVVLMLTACGEKTASGLTPADVAGTWVEDMGDGTDTWTIREDMTYTQSIILTTPPIIETTSDGTYRLEGDTIIIEYPEYDTTSEYKVTLTETTMTWDNGEAQIFYQKK